MIEVASLTRRFGEIVAVREVSFGARTGEILGVLGPNGAGKTTTLRVLCGYLPPTSGRAVVDGIDVTGNPSDVRARIGYLPENNPLYPEMRVSEYLAFRAGLKRVPRREVAGRVGAALARCGLAAVARQTIGTLSKGYRQRVGLADALVAEPPVLVLDEPTSGLDPNQAAETRALVRGLRGKHTILFSSHQLHEVEEVCDRVLIFRRGQIVAADTMENLRRRGAAGATVTVELRGRERLDPLAEGIARVVGVEELPDGFLRATLEAGDDPREALFERAAARGTVLRELTRRELSLEQVFHELTTAPAAAAAPAPAPDGEDAR